MVGVHELLKKRLLDAIRSVQPPGKWKVVVVDAEANKILLSSCKMYDILEENVTLVESLEKPRQPYPELEAVYLLTPTYGSVTRLIEDFGKQTPLYSGAHLFFTAEPDAKLFQRIKTSPVDPFVRGFSPLFVDFHALEAQVFSFESPLSFFKLYSPEETSNLESEIRKMAKQLLSVCVSLDENPSIRYQRSIEADHPAKTIPYKLSMLLQNELDLYTKSRGGNFPSQDKQRPRTTLLIVDRSLDMYAPFLHEFTYQAMANDLLPIEDGKKYSYTYTGSDDVQATKEAILDESDGIWVELRHKHITDTINKIIKDFNEFVGENAGFTDNEKAASVNDMRKMLASLPQFQNQKDKFSLHLNVSQECMELFRAQKLEQIAEIEQNAATGLTSEGHTPKTIFEDLVPILDDPVVSSYNKIRMVLLYILYKNGVLEEDRRKLLSHAGVSPEENEALNNTIYLGVKVTKSPSGGDKHKKSKPKQQEFHYVTSRYVPALKNVIENHIQKTLDQNAYPYTKDPSTETDATGKAAPAQPVSLRSAKAAWYIKGQATETRTSRLLVFVAGGVTYSELRSAYELSEKHKIDIIIGSTHVITPTKFIDDLKILRNPSAAVPSPPPLPHRPNSSPAPPLPNRPNNAGPQQYPNSAPPQANTYNKQYPPNSAPSTSLYNNQVPSPSQGYSNLPPPQGYYPPPGGYGQQGGYRPQQGGYVQQQQGYYPPPANAQFAQYQQPPAQPKKDKSGIGKFFK